MRNFSPKYQSKFKPLGLEGPKCSHISCESFTDLNISIHLGPRGLTNDGTVIISLDAAEADAFNLTLL